MSYNEQIAQKIRETLSGTRMLVEKKMFGGIAFMANNKMCIGVDKNYIMVRCDAGLKRRASGKKGVRPFDLTGKPMKGWLLVSSESVKSKKDFDWWVQLALESNKKATSVKKK